ncbi:MAG: TetR/AcrR family transcriptional regulator [Clostridiales bacterium]|nr:TetR/AcrR family transcriptional regulator [Clostridiales bacterium]
MPPKAKFTREQILNESLLIVRESGIESLTARTLAKRLGSSACPIFTVFDNMEEVITETKQLAKAEYAKYIQKGLCQEIPFKGVGTQYIMFAKNEPKLFQLLFMTEADIGSVDQFLPTIDDNYSLILNSVRVPYGLNEVDAKYLYTHLTIYTHGIATLIARKVVAFTDEDVDRMLSEVFVGLLKELKRRGND